MCRYGASKKVMMSRRGSGGISGGREEKVDYICFEL